MPIYVESCPLGLTDTEITFTVDSDRKPSPTKGCICGGTKQEQVTKEVAMVASTANLVQALGDSILSGRKPVGYKSYEVSGGHNSVVKKVGQ